MPLLQVSNLRVAFPTAAGTLQAVDGVDFSLEPGETLGIVGESGSGKSVTCLALLGLLEGAQVSGEAVFQGKDLLTVSRAELRATRGNSIGMVFQDPLASLNPYHRVGWQIVEAIQAHDRMSRRHARARAAELLGSVGIPHATQRLDDFPHEFSGGMRQRVMIAMALANNPAILIGDEPTTALDVSVQAQILDLIELLQERLGIAVILVTHNLGVVAQVADRVMVMYAGRAVETGDPGQIFHRSAHPYTWGLLSSIPSLSDAHVSAETSNRRLQSIGGLPPNPLAMPAGCRFHPRCPYVMDICRTVEPAYDPVEGERGHLAACHLSPERREAVRLEIAGVRRG
ncbi:MAG TPA: ABC transporter ATP-binding protein [Acidimicrobiales bacterium]|nr:ABC transporter ATP-binding protein [Acidimicrobiales bacterium]